MAGSLEIVVPEAMELDFSLLTNAVERLREGLERHRREPLDEQFRDGLIQRFEFTYELSHRMLQRRTHMTRCRS